MKIKSMKCYQAVYLGPRVDTLFQVQPGDKRKAVQLEVLEGFGIKVTSDEDIIVVPFPNVAYVTLFTPELTKPAAKVAKSA